MHVTRRRSAALCAGILLLAGIAVASAPAASAVGDCQAPPSPGVDWSQCYLAGADLSGADLTHADLTKVDLWFANLTRVDLSGANLTDADLSDAFVACGDGGVLGVGIAGSPVILPDGWTLSGGTLAAPVVPCPPPIPDWVQAYGRDDQDAVCRDGWGPSWATWPNDGAGGFVCQRSIPSLGTPPANPAAASAPGLTVRTRVTTFPTAGAPFTAVQTGSGAVLVSVSDLPVDDPSSQTPAGIEVFEPSGRSYVSTCLVRLPIEVSQANGPASVMGLRLFADGTWLGAAIEDNGLALYRVADLVACTPTPPVIVSQVLSPGALPSGTLDVTFNADSTVAFVDNEYGPAPGSSTGGNVGITQIDLASPGGSALLRQIGTPGDTLAGVTLSPDGSRLYVTTEVAPSGTDVPGSDNPILGGPARCWQPATGVTLYGLLTVMDVDAAVTGSGDPIITTIAAGCSPTRVAVSADGSTLYTSARGDNRVLAFRADALEGPRPADALLGYASTGPAGSEASEPVGLQLFYNDRLLFVANSNRFADPQQGNAEIFDVTDPADPILVTSIATGLFPRNFTLAADGSTMFLTNYASNQVQVIRTLVR